MYGAKKEGKKWEIRNNQELRNMYGQPDIIAEIKSKDLNGWDMRRECKRIELSKEFLKDTPVEGERLGGLGSDGWTILRRI
jgi:hypothetical protein